MKLQSNAAIGIPNVGPVRQSFERFGLSVYSQLFKKFEQSESESFVAFEQLIECPSRSIIIPRLDCISYCADGGTAEVSDRRSDKANLI
jgi:hypothetical protein